MTSANVIEYTIRDASGVEVGRHSQHLYCKSRWYELLKYTPSESYTIQAWGYDEEEEYWEDDPRNLQDFLSGLRELKKKTSA